jgi:hypothetical protein
MMRLTSPCVDGLHTNANRAPVYRRTTTLKSGAVVGDRGGAELHPTQDQRQPSRRAASGGDDDVVAQLPEAAPALRRPDRAPVPERAASPSATYWRILLTLNQPVVEQQPGIEPGSRAKASRQATALADLSVAEAGERLVLDWNAPNRHATFYKAVFRAAVLRANRRPAEMGDPTAALPPQLKWHALRHTYASLCIAAGRPPLEVARFMATRRSPRHLASTPTYSTPTTTPTR